MRVSYTLSIRTRISRAKFRQILKLFALDLTALSEMFGEVFGVWVVGPEGEASVYLQLVSHQGEVYGGVEGAVSGLYEIRPRDTLRRSNLWLAHFS